MRRKIIWGRKVILINYKELVDIVFFLIGISISESISGQRAELLAKNLFGSIWQMRCLGFRFETMISFWSNRMVAHILSLFPCLSHSAGLVCFRAGSRTALVLNCSMYVFFKLCNFFMDGL